LAAHRAGFDACGTAMARSLTDDENHLREWLSGGMHGEMDYMQRHFEKRINPAILVPGAKSVISVLLNYFPGHPAISTQSPKISRYAIGADYHRVVKAMLWAMLDLLRQEHGNINGRAFVDSAPVLERAWARESGLGWIGKNGMLINPQIGSFTFIGELIVDSEVETAKAEVPNRCGTCTRCMDACPTGAIVAPHVVDARKCIPYLTIEKKTPLTEQERPMLNGWCFGCDICQEVCPWNARAKASDFPAAQALDTVISVENKKLINLTKSEFETTFGQTPMTRAGFTKFMDNCRHL